MKVYVECKRIKSEKALEENYRKAGKQLEKVVDGESYGLVFIDIYNCIANEVRDYEYINITEMQKSVHGVVDKFYSNRRKKINEILEKQIKFSLGVCFTSNRCLWLSNVTPQFYKSYYVIAPQSISSEKYNKLQEILK